PSLILLEGYFQMVNRPRIEYNGHMKQLWHREREAYLLLAVIVAAAVIRFYRLGGQSFWTDELLSIQISAAPPGVSFWKKVLWDVHGPLHSLILHHWRKISMAEAWLRTTSVIPGVLGAFLMYRWLVRIRMKDAALACALLFALNPFNLYYSQELRFYSLLTLLSILSLIVFEWFLDRPSYRRAVMLGLVLALTCLSHFSGGFLCLAFLIYLLVTGRFRGRLLRSALLAACLVLVIISPWIYREIMFLRGINVVDISSLSSKEKLRGELTLSSWSYPYILYAFSVGFSFGPDLRELHLITSAFDIVHRYGFEIVAAMSLFGALVIAGLVRITRMGRLPLFASIIIVTLAATTAITMLNIKVFNVRYLTCMFPAFLALVAAGLPSARIPRYALLGAVCALSLISDWNYHHVGRYARDDVKGAVAIITEFEVEGDVILAPTVRHTVAYYYSGQNEVAFFIPKLLGEDEIRERIRWYFEGGGGRVWYLRCRHWDIDPEDVLPGVLDSEGRLLAQWERPGIVILLYALRVMPDGGG
ncbi:MAG: glycosyltransferase family 39 protein, partial [bacterium]